jgi:hypothetical protein
VSFAVGAGAFEERPPCRSFKAAAAGGGATVALFFFAKGAMAGDFGIGAFARITAVGFFGRAWTGAGFRASRGTLGAAGTLAVAAAAVGRTRTCEERRGEEVSCVGGGGV